MQLWSWPVSGNPKALEVLIKLALAVLYFDVFENKC
jgi:hypothetical protein